MVFGVDRQGVFGWQFNRLHVLKFSDLMFTIYQSRRGSWSLRLMQMQCLPTLHPCLSCICKHSLVHLQAEHSQNLFSIVLFRCLWTLETETWTGEALRTRSVTFVDSRATALEHARHMSNDAAGDSQRQYRKNRQRKKCLRSQIMIRKNVPWEG